MHQTLCEENYANHCAKSYLLSRDMAPKLSRKWFSIAKDLLEKECEAELDNSRALLEHLASACKKQDKSCRDLQLEIAIRKKRERDSLADRELKEPEIRALENSGNTGSKFMNCMTSTSFGITTTNCAGHCGGKYISSTSD